VALHDGSILVIGHEGDDSDGGAIFDPSTGDSRRIDSVGGNAFAVPLVLRDGRVLLVGTQDAGVASNQAMLLDPATGALSSAGTMTRPRGDFSTTTLLADGRVLIVGGVRGFEHTAEIFDPVNGESSAVGSMTTPRIGFTATLLPDGRVLIAAGAVNNAAPVTTQFRSDAEIFDPATNAFTVVGPMTITRAFHAAVALADGRVLIAGGEDPEDVRGGIAAAELFDPATNTFQLAPPMTSGRADADGVVLPSGEVLLAGNHCAAPTCVPSAADTTGDLFR